MLLEFKVGNFISFKETNVLRMAQFQESENPEGSVFGEPSDLMLIYGANASGKSNLIKAMAFSRDIALYGASDLKVCRYHGCRGPSYFEYVVELDGTIYSYGFELRLETMELFSEWLYILEPEGDRCIYEYERKKTEKRNNKRNCCCRTKMNSSTDNVHMVRVRKWLQHSVFIENSGMKDEILPIPEDVSQRLSYLLMEMETGIMDVIEEPFVNTDIPQNLIRRIPNRGIIEADGDYLAIVAGNRSKRGWLIHIIRRNGVNEYRNVGLVHEKGHVSTIDDESSGTMRMIHIIILMLMLKQSELSDGLVVMDNMERSMHSLVIEGLVEMFVGSIYKKGQLIATTYKTYLLENPMIEDSCISFINIDNRKNEGSELYTLESIDRRFKDRHRAYMDGRYAAIPNIYSIIVE